MTSSRSQKGKRRPSIYVELRTQPTGAPLTRANVRESGAESEQVGAHLDALAPEIGSRVPLPDGRGATMYDKINDTLTANKISEESNRRFHEGSPVLIWYPAWLRATESGA
jgi:hypothetical protein